MTFSSWINWCLSVIVTAVNWLKSATILNVPLLYLLLGSFVWILIILGEGMDGNHSGRRYYDGKNFAKVI